MLEKKNTGYSILILIFLLVFEDNFQVHALGGLYSAEQFKAGFLALRVFGAYFWLIHGGADFRNFTVILACSQTLCFLFKVRLTGVIKYKPQGIY